MSTVTSSELMATITGKGIRSPPPVADRLANGHNEEPDDLLFTPSNKEPTDSLKSEMENIAPNVAKL